MISHEHRIHRKTPHWTDEEKEYFKIVYQDRDRAHETIEELTQEFPNRSKQSLQGMAKRLRIYRPIIYLEDYCPYCGQMMKKEVVIK